jgi:aspartate/methionine/tyrosine aminotransferase
MSKVYGLPGLRVGWCLAAPRLLEKMVRVRDYVTLHLSPLVEFIAEKAVRHADRLIALRLGQARRNLELVADWAASESGRVSWVRPAGGVTVFPRLSMPDTEPLCRRLAEERKVLLVPGSCFGHPEHVRLGFGGASAQLERGLAQLSSLLPSGA